MGGFSNGLHLNVQKRVLESENGPRCILKEKERERKRERERE